jgi:hypothetical protein
MHPQVEKAALKKPAMGNFILSALMDKCEFIALSLGLSGYLAVFTAKFDDANLEVSPGFQCGVVYAL